MTAAPDAGADSAPPDFDPSIDLPPLAKATWGDFLPGSDTGGVAAAHADADWTDLQPPPPGLIAGGPQSVTVAPLADGSQLLPFDPTGGVAFNPTPGPTPLQLDAQNYLSGYGVAPGGVAPVTDGLDRDLDLAGGTVSPGSYEVADNGGFVLNNRGVPSASNPPGADKSSGARSSVPASAQAKTAPASLVASKPANGDAAAGFGAEAGAPPTVSDAAAFADISSTEVSNSAATADRMTPPQKKGGGWTIGWEQEDFLGDPKTAQATLAGALTASGYLDSDNAQKAAAAFAAANRSSEVNLKGVVDSQGDPVDLETINDALSTTPARSSIYNSSYNNYTKKSDILIDGINRNENVFPSVKSAISDPIYGPMIRLVLEDYNNKMYLNPSSADGMMGLLTTGNVTTEQNRKTTLDQSSPRAILYSIMKYYLNTHYAAAGNGADVTRRLTNDVQAAANAESAAHLTPPATPIAVTSMDGTMVVSPISGGNSYRGTWKPSN